MTGLLERVDLKCDGPDEFAEKCRKELGYSAIAKSFVDNRVLECFRQLGIRPFDNKTVEAYKAKKQKQANDQEWLPWYRICQWISIGICLIATGLVIGSGSPWFFLIAVLAVVPASVYHDGKAEFRDEWTWDNTNLKNYNKAIPKYALEVALQVQEHFQDDKDHYVLCVDELVYEQRKKTLDPFLFLRVYPSDARYYLEVWDEPDFGAKRTV